MAMASLTFTLDHRWAPPRMSAYVEDDLSRRGRRRMERHVGLCPVCARKLRALREVVRGLGLLAARPAPPAEGTGPPAAEVAGPPEASALSTAVLARLRGEDPGGGHPPARAG
jgi:anti-sigma factor RsiW